MPNLNWKLLTKKRAGVTKGLPPGKEDLAWVTNTVALIYGERDAVLVDTFLSVQHSKELVDWLVESGKNLTTIHITHAHGDHFFGLFQQHQIVVNNAQVVLDADLVTLTPQTAKSPPGGKRAASPFASQAQLTCQFWFGYDASEIWEDLDGLQPRRMLPLSKNLRLAGSLTSPG